MPRNRRPDFPFLSRDFAAHNRVINLLGRPPGELFRQRDMRRVVFRHHETAAGFLVQPVDDARPRHAADAAQPARAMMQQRVDQRVFLVARRRMHHQPRRFVQHQQVRVLK